MASDDPLQKVSISGPTLASLIQRIFTSQSDIDGLLFGHVTTSSLNSLSDDDNPSATTLTATITSFISASSKPYFYTSTGQIDLLKLRSLIPHQSSSPPLTLIGWFSGRRQTSPRPSMREYAVTRSITSISQLYFPVRDSEPSFAFAPCVFLLFTTPYSGVEQAIHTHEYRAYQFRSGVGLFEARSIDVVNIGPAFRSHYGNFSPSASMFPMIRYECRENLMMVEEKRVSLSEKKRIANDQRELDFCAQGFEVGKLSRLVGAEAVNYTSNLEDLYGSMLAKLESLARQVEKSNGLVNEKELANMKLRHKVAGLD